MSKNRQLALIYLTTVIISTKINVFELTFDRAYLAQIYVYNKILYFVFGIIFDVTLILFVGLTLTWTVPGSVFLFPKRAERSEAKSPPKNLFLFIILILAGIVNILLFIWIRWLQER